MNNKNKEILLPLFSILAAFLVVAVIILLKGSNPFEAYSAIFKRAFFAKRALPNTLLEATPLILTGLAVAFAFKGGLFNIGVQGQMVIGGLGAVIVGTLFNGIISNVFFAVIAAMIFGALWAMLAGWLKARFGVHEVISTIMLNNIANPLKNYLINGALKDPNSQNVQTAPVHELARLFNLVPKTKLNFGLILAIIAALVVLFVLSKTIFGFELKTVGLNLTTAENVGIRINRKIVVIMAISGALAGLAGAERVLGGVGQYSYTKDIMGDYGFQGIAIALLGKNNPIGIIFAAILFAALQTGGAGLQSIGLQKDLVQIISALIIIFVAAENMFKFLLDKRKEVK